ncbi:MAG TPA: hypothetical protein VFY29_08900 [Terriglobia bacterium]|nr:hypothetical protein [Terriglobia bacterium]
MTFRRSLVAGAIVGVVTVLLTAIVGAGAARTAATLPSEISDAEFWRMIVDLSEPGGAYPYENFVSNEIIVQHVIPALKVTTKPGGVYIGVGPEQNFTYVSALQSNLAFIVDIRRQNMLELLMYKALFELSVDRADFVGRLFSRARPTGIDAGATPAALFSAFGSVQADADLYAQNLGDVKASLKRHGFQLSSDDLLRIDYVYQVFYRGGPGITYEFASPSPSSLSGPPSYALLMNASDTTGHNWSFLATEENYRYVREMQRKNLIVPLVGDFAGPAVIRNIGRYLQERDATVTAFYVSNVEYYLNPSQKQVFYANLAALPVDSSSMLIRFILGSQARLLPWWNAGGNAIAISPLIDLTRAVQSGLRPSFEDMLRETKDPYAMAGVSR